MDVDIVNIDPNNELWLVDNINIYIDYTEFDNITIDQNNTSGSLNHEISENYKGIDGNDIVTFDPLNGRIEIRAVLKDGGLRQHINEIADLITIFFKGKHSTTVVFSFEYTNPQTNMKLWEWDPPYNQYICKPKALPYDPQGGINYHINREYTFDDATENYDLAFGKVLPSYDCQINEIGVDIVNIEEDAMNDEIDTLNVYIKYEIISGADITILPETFEEGLNPDISDNYEAINGTDIVTFDQVNKTISINAKIKEDGTKQTISHVSNLLTIYFKGNPSTSVEFHFLYDMPTESIMFLHDGNNECYVSVPYQYNYPDVEYYSIRQFNFPDIKANYDLAFEGIQGCTEPYNLKEMGVSIVNIDNGDEGWNVKYLKVYINYAGNIDIDINKTRLSLNYNLSLKFEGMNGNSDIVNINSQTISIEAKVINEYVDVPIKDISDLITIYFSGPPSTPSSFTFPTSNEMMLFDDEGSCVQCEPKHDYQNNYVTVKQYIIPAETQKYDLAFSEFNEPEGDCDLADVDVNIVEINNDVENWEVNLLKVYVKYQVIGSGSAEINLPKTKQYLNDKITKNYKEIGNEIVKLYVNDSKSGIIAIEAKVKEDGTKQNLDAISNLIKIFFTGAPSTKIRFSFAYGLSGTLKSVINLCDNDENNPDSHYCYPYENDDPLFTGYYIKRDYTFSDELKFVGIVSNMSDGTAQGRCDGEVVPMQEGVTMSFYKNNFLQCNPLTKGKGEVDCLGESLYGKAVCKMGQTPPINLVKIEPEIEICGLEGVTTLDIVLIQMHLLGIKPFKYAYQLFAADVTNDGRISASDILKIRKVILGSLPSSALSFDFIPEDIFIDVECNSCSDYYGYAYVWGDNTNTVYHTENNANFSQYIEIEDNDIDYNSANIAKFHGFKEGDVNNSCNNCDNSGCGGGEGDNGTHDIFIDNVEEEGDTIEVTVKTGGKDSVEIIGVTLDIDPKGIELDTLLTTDAVDTVPIYNYNQETGILKIIWENKNAYNGVSSTKDNIFTLKFKKGLYSAADLNIKISNSVGPHYTVKSGLAYTTEFDQNLKSRSIIKQTNNLNRFEITPTIFKDRLILNYTSDVKSKADFTLYNNIGQIVYNKNLTVNKGDNDFELRGFENIQNGVIYYKLKCGNKQFTGKLIK